MLYWKRNDQGKNIDEHFIHIVFYHRSLAVLLIYYIPSKWCHGWQYRRTRKKGEGFGFSKLKDRYIHVFDPVLVLRALLSQKKVHSHVCSRHGLSFYHVHFTRAKTQLVLYLDFCPAGKEVDLSKKVSQWLVCQHQPWLSLEHRPSLDPSNSAPEASVRILQNACPVML